MVYNKIISIRGVQLSRGYSSIKRYHKGISKSRNCRYKEGIQDIIQTFISKFLNYFKLKSW